jgi:hypothetical protein
MHIDARFPTKLETVDDVPEPPRRALKDNLSSEESIDLLVYLPAYSSLDELAPATATAPQCETLNSER